MKILFNQVGLIGVGLIGGSLGLAIRRKKLACRVIGFGRNKHNLVWAIQNGLIDDKACSLHKMAGECDLLVLSTPVQTIQNFLPLLARWAKPGTIIMDVGSTKEQIVKTADRLIKKPLFFIGAHPMAGKEMGGAKEAQDNLFEGTTCILTPSSNNAAGPLGRIKELWQRVGCNVVIEDPHKHDRFVAAVSHLPQMSSYALMTAVSRLVPRQKIPIIAGSGFRDTTRLAGSPADMWVDICETNHFFLSRALKNYQKELTFLENAIRKKKRGELKKYFKRARKKKLLAGK